MNKKLSKLLFTSASTVALLAVYPQISKNIEQVEWGGAMLTVEAASSRGEMFVIKTKELPSVAQLNRMNSRELIKANISIQNARAIYNRLSTAEKENADVSRWNNYLSLKESVLPQSDWFIEEAKKLANISELIEMNPKELTEAKSAIRAVRNFYNNLSETNKVNADVTRWSEYLKQKETAVGITFIDEVKKLPKVADMDLNDVDAVKEARKLYLTLPTLVKSEAEVARWVGYLNQKETAVGHAFIRATKQLPRLSEIGELDADQLAELEAEANKIKKAYESLPDLAKKRDDVNRWSDFLKQKEEAIRHVSEERGEPEKPEEPVLPVEPEKPTPPLTPGIPVVPVTPEFNEETFKNDFAKRIETELIKLNLKFPYKYDVKEKQFEVVIDEGTSIYDFMGFGALLRLKNVVENSELVSFQIGSNPVRNLVGTHTDDVKKWGIRDLADEFEINVRNLFLLADQSTSVHLTFKNGIKDTYTIGFIAGERLSDGYKFTQAVKKLPAVSKIRQMNPEEYAKTKENIQELRTTYRALSTSDKEDTLVIRWEGYLTEKEEAVGISFVELVRNLPYVSEINQMNLEDFAEVKALIQELRDRYNTLPSSDKQDTSVIRWEGYLTEKEAAVGIIFIEAVKALPNHLEMDEMNEEHLIQTAIAVGEARSQYEKLSNVVRSDADVAAQIFILSEKEQRLPLLRGFTKVVTELPDETEISEMSADEIRVIINDIETARALYKNLTTEEQDEVLEMEAHLSEIETMTREVAKVVIAHEKHFTFNARTGTITNYDISGGAAVKIPRTIGGVEVKNIGSRAFYNKLIRTVSIPDNIVRIGDYAFSQNYLTEVSIPNSVEYLGYSAFSNNKLVDVNLSSNVTILNESVFSHNKLTGIKIPDGVTRIGGYAFADNSLTNLEIPNTVTHIEMAAFRNNILTNVFIPNSVTYVGEGAFENNSLTELLIPDSIIHIKSYAFSHNSLTNLFVPDSVRDLGSGAFSYNKLESVKISNKIRRISDRLFAGNNLTKVEIPNSVIEIEGYAFHDNNLISLTVPDNVRRIQYNAFSSNEIETITFGKELLDIGNYAFAKNRLTDVTLPDSLLVVGEGALIENDLTSITLGSNVDIGTTLLNWYEDNFKNAYLENGKSSGTYSKTEAGDWQPKMVVEQLLEAAKEKAIEDLKQYADTNDYKTNAETLADAIENGYAEIGSAHTITEINNALVEAQKVIDKIETDAEITEREAGENEDETENEQYFEFDPSTGTITNYDTIGGPIVNIPRTIGGVTVKNIGYESFANKGLISVSIPNSIVSIGTFAFANKLTEITIPTGVTHIRHAAFRNNLLTNVMIPSNITDIEPYAFANNSLTSVTIPDSVTQIGDGAFSYNNLESVELSNKIERISPELFSFNKLVKVELPDSVIKIENNAFSSNQIKNITFGENLTSIGHGAFSDNKLTHVVLPNSLKRIEGFALVGNSLSSITLGDNITIGSYLINYNDNDFQSVYYGNENSSGTYTRIHTGYWEKQN